jgi:hypothetical protein
MTQFKERWMRMIWTMTNYEPKCRGAKTAVRLVKTFDAMEGHEDDIGDGYDGAMDDRRRELMQV